MKICSLYGAGFYYIPGTDTCIKIGGYVRVEYDLNATGSFTPILNGANARFTRSSQVVTNRARGLVTFDAREQTEYGTLRSYISGGWQTDNGATPGAATAVYRFFVQLAGFTAGWSTSFFDFYVTPTYSNMTNVLGSDISGSGVTVFGYTATFGNGLSASLALEDTNARRTQIFNTSNGTLADFVTGTTNGTLTVNSYATSQIPDLVGSVRVDQTWGSAQVMGALHQVNALYNTTLETSGHPSDEVGFAVGAGATLFLPMLAQGDSVSAQVTYVEGAMKYIGSGLTGFSIYHGNSVGLGLVTDGVYQGASASDLQLTKGWSVVAGIDHHWRPDLKTSLYGDYAKIDYNNTATGFINTNFGVVNGDPDFSFWQIGSRTVWSWTRNFDLSVDVVYNKLNTSYRGAALVLSPGGGKPTTTYTVGDQDVWSGIVRVQRNFYP